MKKIILTAVIAVAGLISAHAQEGFKVGAHIGVPVGDATDYFGINFGAEASYLYPVMENLHVGGTVGIDIFSGKSEPHSIYKNENNTLVPLMISGQYDFLDQFFAGIDLGYAFSLNDVYKGGFVFQPKGGWQNDMFQAFVFVKGISSEIDEDDIIVPAGTEFKNYSNLMVIGVGGAYKF